MQGCVTLDRESNKVRLIAQTFMRLIFSTVRLGRKWHRTSTFLKKDHKQTFANPHKCVQRLNKIRRDKYEPLNRTSSRIVWVDAASELAQEFRIVLSAKVKIKNSSSSVNSRLSVIRLILLRAGFYCSASRGRKN